MPCRYLVSRFFPHDNGGGSWVYGYPCGGPTVDKATSACRHHADRYFPVSHFPLPWWMGPEPEAV